MSERTTPAAGRPSAVTVKAPAFRAQTVLAALVILLVVMVPESALAQTGPFSTGTTAFSTDLLTILTPLAVVATMVLGVLALFHVVNWAWFVGALGGIVLIFGAPQIVAWTRGLFGV